jgi:hypothetical protein
MERSTAMHAQISDLVLYDIYPSFGADGKAQRREQNNEGNELKSCGGSVELGQLAGLQGKWKPVTKLNRHIEDARKSVAARYLQLKSDHAVTGTHPMRIEKVVGARCWWCKRSGQTVTHLFLECRKWRTERETMIRKLRDKEVATIPDEHAAL